MEAVEHLHCLRGALCDHLQVGLPHVRAHEVQGCAACGAEPVEEALQGCGLAFASDPQQALAVAIDLIDQRQVALPAAARELVDADGFDVGEVAVGEAPVDGPAHGPMDGVPGGGERGGHLLPRQALGPPGEAPGVGIGQSVLAGGPREGLDPHAAARAGHAAHGVEEDHGDVPQGHEVEAPDRQRVVARGRAPALRAFRAGSGTGTYADLDAQPRVLHQPHRFVDERRVLLDPIQDSLELHPVPLPRRLDVVQPPLSRIPERDALL